MLTLITVLAPLGACNGDDDDVASLDGAPPDAGFDAGPDADPGAPALRNPVDLPDGELAAQALVLLGDSAKGGVCGDCHTPGRPLLRRWETVGQGAAKGCLTDLAVSTPESARAMLDCLRADPKDGASPFVAARLGPFASAAHLGWFEYTFHKAYGDSWQSEYTSFKNKVSMPKGTHAPFTQGQFDVVAEWFARGLPELDNLVPGEPPPEGCTPGIGAAVASHVNELATTGWRAQNAEAGLKMLGCQDTSDPRDCLKSFPRATSKAYGVGWETLPGTKLRVLFETDDRSSFWTRSSADGRFVASGRANDSEFYRAAFIDVQSQKVIPTRASYDPGFFPDNTGFVFQGTEQGAAFCPTSVLTAGPDMLDLDEPGCRSTDVVQLYQHVGASLSGGDYWNVDSEFVSDDGGDEFNGYADPLAQFEAGAELRFTPMVNTGNGFVPGERVHVASPFEGDAVISPSARLVVTRAAGNDFEQSGFVLRQVKSKAAGGGFTVETPEIARYCLRGGKPGFSYDERFMVIHHYIEEEDAVELGFTDALDPAFQPYRELRAANVYLIDLVTGSRTRITTMHAGQFALFPHFRSDGWIYFIVRDRNKTGEVVVASDAALVLAAQ